MQRQPSLQGEHEEEALAVQHGPAINDGTPGLAAGLLALC